MSTQMVPMQSAEERGSSDLVPVVPARYICFGAFHLDLQKEELLKDGSRIKLQGKVYRALVALLQKRGEIVTREELRMRLWPSGKHVNYDANVNTTVNKLRQLLGDSPDQPVFVETIPRKGYSFIAGVNYVNSIDGALVPQAPLAADLSPVTGVAEYAMGKASFFRMAIHSRWLTAGVVALVITSMLFGAALALYAHR
jgi:DNA-binding winged helix-turn-helix (wHTH) protein